MSGETYVTDIFFKIGSVFGMGAWIPWVITFLLRFFRKGQVSFYETVPMQLGYTAWGPVIVLEGVMRAMGHDMFVERAILSITKDKDKSIHDFEWWIVRPEISYTGRESGRGWPPAYPITLRTFQSEPRAIGFRDLKMYSEIKSVTNELSKEWSKQRGDLFLQLQRKAYLHAGPSRESLMNLQKEFQKTKYWNEAFNRINKLCYWEAGSYSLKMVIHTSKPDGVFPEKRRFEITPEEAKMLELNAVTILEDVCGLRQWQYFYVPIELKSQ